ncbi:MAG: hypothetical protein RRY33_08150, partial [Alistipes sp.]
MKFQSKYNIGDTVTIEQKNGKNKVLITEINATKISGREVGISYVGDTTTPVNFCEDAITGIVFSVANIEQVPSKISNGVYIHTANGTLIPLSDAKEDKTALGVVLITEHARIFIDKHEPEYMEWDGAMEFCASEPSYNSEPFRLPDTHEGQEIAFNREQINKAMDFIGGDAIEAN